MIDIPAKGEILVTEVPAFTLMQLYKLYHKFQLVTELYYNNVPAINLISNDGNMDETEEYKHISDWIKGDIAK